MKIINLISIFFTFIVQFFIISMTIAEAEHGSVRGGILEATKAPTVAAICQCRGDGCALVPPASDPGFPCYQGNNQNATDCYLTDPLLQPGTVWYCGTCSSYGFPFYLRNDPIYVNMELWSQTSVAPTAAPIASP